MNDTHIEMAKSINEHIVQLRTCAAAVKNGIFKRYISMPLLKNLFELEVSGTSFVFSFPLLNAEINVIERIAFDNKKQPHYLIQFSSKNGDIIVTANIDINGLVHINDTKEMCQIAYDSETLADSILSEIFTKLAIRNEITC